MQGGGLVITSLFSVAVEKNNEIWIHFKQILNIFMYMCKIIYVNPLNDRNITLLA